MSNVEYFSWRRKVDIFTLYQRISSFLTYRITDLGPWSNYWTFTHIYHYMWLYVILFFYSRSLFPLFPGTSYLGYPISISNSVWWVSCLKSDSLTLFSLLIMVLPLTQARIFNIFDSCTYQSLHSVDDQILNMLTFPVSKNCPFLCMSLFSY